MLLLARLPAFQQDRLPLSACAAAQQPLTSADLKQRVGITRFGKQNMLLVSSSSSSSSSRSRCSTVCPAAAMLGYQQYLPTSLPDKGKQGSNL
jgi:hypothetical protein